uniref:Rad60/SUMO-like domain-containing protein n=1 Tax=Colobus angolensis palliatus TaxID=336983 RepID=A0A2K5HAM4_COLAP
MANEKPKEGVKTENNDHIKLKVAGQDASVVQFKIKRHTPLSKLKKVCQSLPSRLGNSVIPT